jgi:hypothetical protein
MEAELRRQKFNLSFALIRGYFFSQLPFSRLRGDSGGSTMDNALALSEGIQSINNGESSGKEESASNFLKALR